MKYKIHVRQAGEGCDYTIGCGHALYDIDIDNITISDLESEILNSEDEEGYVTIAGTQIELDTIESITIYVISDVIPVNIGQLKLMSILKADQRKKEEQEKRKKELYLKLKKEYGE